MNRRSITQLPRALERLTGQTVSYRRVYFACVDNRIPVEQTQNGRWQYDPNELPQIAAALGFVTSNEASQAA